MPKAKQYNTKILYFSNRITKAMDGILDHPLTILEAPMGYGKTTAVRDALQRFDGNVLWQNVYGEDANGFWLGFCAALSKLDAELSESLRCMGIPRDATLMNEAIRIFRAVRVPPRTFFVIDDYHFIRNEEVDEFIFFLLQNLPETLHLIILTRTPFQKDNSELRLKGFINHIGLETLAFTADDISKYYKLCGVITTAEEQEMLYSYSEGWVSALYLFVMEYAQQGKFVMTRDISMLVRQNVYLPLSDELKNFLNCVCLFDVFSETQAQYMWPKGNAAELIDELLDRNAFITCDRLTGDYHLHNIFNACVRAEFVKLPVCAQKEIRHHAGAWHLIAGEALPAMDYFFRAGSFDDMLLALEAGKGNHFTVENVRRLIGYMTDCPGEIRARHQFALLVYARKLYGANELELFGSTCAEFIANIEDDHELNQEDKDSLLGDYELLMSFTKYNDIFKMSEHHQKANLLMKTTSRIIDANSNWTFGSPSVLSMFYRESGMLTFEVETMKRHLPYYTQLTSGQGSGAEYVMEAEACFYCGELSEAEACIHKAVYQASLSEQWSILLCTTYLQCRLEVFQGDYTAALCLIEEMRTKLAENKQYAFYHTMDLCEGYIYVLLGQPQKIAGWLSKGERLNTKLLFPAMPMLHAIYGRVLLEQREYSKLIGLSEPFLKTAGTFPYLLCLIYIHIYLAVANEMLGNRDRAISSLKEALDIAVPDRLYMPFVENGMVIQGLLWKSNLFQEYAEFSEQCYRLYETYSVSIEAIRREYFTESGAKLTKREREVADLAIQGYSNREIGERLFITENTVKTRMKSIFQKLNVKSRVQLIKKH